ncbi:MAG: DNRLRE domain-containing protein [Armatimonadetes bacterium]|nr:DNRLRE domain-containing protein [Armatimonadota bacterium]
MKRLHIFLAVFAVSLCFLLPAQAQTDGQIVLKHGSGGYYGTTDTWIDYSNPSTNYGSSTEMNVKMFSSSPRNSGLIKFDLTGQLPNNPWLRITSATLSLYLVRLEEFGSGDWMYIGPYMIRDYKDWVENQANWNVFKGSTYWATAGCENTTWDRYPNPDSLVYFYYGMAAGIYYNWNVTNSVKKWVEEGKPNNGWLMRAYSHDGGGDVVVFATKEGSLGVRPKLTINYTIIPEPASILALSMGVLTLIGAARRRK